MQVSANGLQFEVERFGRVNDPAILLIMGLGGQLTMWPQPLCEGLAERGFHVIRFDNRDAGLSTHLDHLGMPDLQAAMAALFSGQSVTAPYRLADMAADAVAVLSTLGIGNAHIVGASMGGMIAQLVAIQNPEVTRSLTSIMSTTGRPGLPQATPEASAALTTPPASDSREDRIRAGVKVAKVIGSPGFRDPDDVLTAFVAEQVDRAPYDGAAFARQLTAIIAGPPRHEMLASVSAPARVIHGADDPLVPLACGQDTAASIPGAELVVVPGMGHGFESALVPVYLETIGDFVAAVERRARG